MSTENNKYSVLTRHRPKLSAGFGYGFTIPPDTGYFKEHFPILDQIVKSAESWFIASDEIYWNDVKVFHSILEKLSIDQKELLYRIEWDLPAGRNLDTKSLLITEEEAVAFIRASRNQPDEWFANQPEIFSIIW